MRSLVAAILVSAFVMLFAVLARFGAVPARAQQPAAGAAGAGGGAAPAAPANCKLFKGTKCCDPAVTLHLPREAVYSACGESDASYAGEHAQNDTCRYFFKAQGDKPEDAFVQVYVPKVKETPAAPNDPFFRWKRVGKVFVTDKALSPKSAPMLTNSTGLWLAGKGYVVSVSASTKVCTRPEAERLAKSLK